MDCQSRQQERATHYISCCNVSNSILLIYVWDRLWLAMRLWLLGLVSISKKFCINVHLFSASMNIQICNPSFNYSEQGYRSSRCKLRPRLLASPKELPIKSFLLAIFHKNPFAIGLINYWKFTSIAYNPLISGQCHIAEKSAPICDFILNEFAHFIKTPFLLVLLNNRSSPFFIKIPFFYWLN